MNETKQAVSGNSPGDTGEQGKTGAGGVPAERGSCEAGGKCGNECGDCVGVTYGTGGVAIPDRRKGEGAGFAGGERRKSVVDRRAGLERRVIDIGSPTGLERRRGPGAVGRTIAVRRKREK